MGAQSKGAGRLLTRDGYAWGTAWEWDVDVPSLAGATRYEYKAGLFSGWGEGNIAGEPGDGTGAGQHSTPPERYLSRRRRKP
jgi:hypothetical protein